HMRQARRRRELAAHVVVANAQRAAGDHLGDDEPGAITRRQLAHRPVGDPRHRREERPVAERRAADAQAAGRVTHRLHLLYAFAGIARTIVKSYGHATGHCAASRGLSSEFSAARPTTSPAE